MVGSQPRYLGDDTMPALPEFIDPGGSSLACIKCHQDRLREKARYL